MRWFTTPIDRSIRHVTVVAGLGLLAASVTTPAVGADWVSVAKTDRTEIFVDDASLAQSGPYVLVRTRQNFTEPQPAARKGKTFLSARNEYRIDCAGRRLAYGEIRAYALADLEGDVVQKTRIGDKNLKWMDAPMGTVFGELLDHSCTHAPSTVAPAQ